MNLGFCDIDDNFYITCEEHSAQIKRNIRVCYVCKERHECKKILKMWKNWYENLEILEREKI